MTRTTDADPRPLQPLGEKVTRQVTAKPEWPDKPCAPGIQQGADGKLRTNLPLPKAKP